MARLTTTKPEGAPSYVDMITQALVYEAETESDHGRKGCSLQFIKKYLEEHYKLDVKALRVKNQIKKSIESGISKGTWIHPGDNVARIKLTPEAKKDEAKINNAKIQSGLEDPNDMVEVASESEESELSDSPAPKKKSTAKATKKAPAKKSTASGKKTTSSTTKKASPVKSTSKAKATTSSSKATKKKK